MVLSLVTPLLIARRHAVSLDDKVHDDALTIVFVEPLFRV